MKWRLALGLASFGLFGLVASAPADVRLRLALAGLAALSLVAALMPDYALRWIRDNWRPLLRLLVSVAVMVLGLIGAHHHLPAGSASLGGQFGVGGAELSYILIDPTLRRWVKFIT